jgi:hypothetical protein
MWVMRQAGIILLVVLYSVIKPVLLNLIFNVLNKCLY